MGSDKVNTIKNARSYKAGYEYLLAYKLTVPICDYTIEMCTVAIKINKLIKNIKNIILTMSKQCQTLLVSPRWRHKLSSRDFKFLYYPLISFKMMFVDCNY
jgi:hypothetical protein